MAESSTIYLSDISDRTIIVGKIRQHFKVSSIAMAMASPVWKAMLNPMSGFREANPETAIELPDDEPDAFLLILRIAHLQFQSLPSAITFDLLFQLAVICDKYDCVDLVRPFIRSWVDPWTMVCLEPGYEGWLFIAWTFGCTQISSLLVASLVRSIEVDHKGREKDVESLKALKHMPQELIEDILAIRLGIISKLLDLFYDTLTRLMDNQYFTDDCGSSVTCNHIGLALLVKALHSLQLSSEKCPGENILLSVNSLASYMDDIGWYSEFMEPYHICFLGETLKPKIEEIIITGTPLHVERLSVRNLEKQTATKGLKNLSVPSLKGIFLTDFEAYSINNIGLTARTVL